MVDAGAKELNCGMTLRIVAHARVERVKSKEEKNQAPRLTQKNAAKTPGSSYWKRRSVAKEQE